MNTQQVKSEKIPAPGDTLEAQLAKVSTKRATHTERVGHVD